MKLFQKLLVASTALGLLTPIAAQATEAVNLDDMDSYRRSSSKVKKFDSNTFANEISEDVATLNGRVDGLEARQNNFEAGSFSSTTTMDGKAVFAVGGVDGGDTIGGSEALSYAYVYKMNLNTSFTGDDNLYVRLSAGEWGSNFTKKPGNYHIEAKNTGNTLKLDKIWWLVTPQNRLKKNNIKNTFQNRLQKAREFTKNTKKITVLDIEYKNKLSSSYKTMRFIKNKTQKTKFVWIMGSDNLENFHQWLKPKLISKIFPVAVIERPSYSYRVLNCIGASILGKRLKNLKKESFYNNSSSWVFVKDKLDNTSSTKIRNDSLN